MKTILFAGRFGTNGTRLARGIGMVLAGLMLAGCPASPSSPTTTPSSSGKIVIRGSNTVGEELAPHLITAFKKDHPAADFDLETKATGYGLAALRAGQCDIAAASRPVSKEETDEAQRMGVELNDHVIGAYSVAVVVNANNPVANLTRAQVRDIFTGVTKNWKDVGGPDAPINIYVRDPISGTYLGFKELAMEDKDYALSRKLVSSYQEIAKAVGQDPNGIGYSCFELPKEANAKSVSIDGIEATAATVNAGKYPYARILHLYTNKAKEGASAKEFVDFVESANGQAVLVASGFVPHS